MSTPIDRFEGTYQFLSNFWPCEVTLDGETYPSVEHAFQAAKTLDPAERKKIRLAPDGKAVKRLGRKVTMRDDWDALKPVHMYNLLEQKFARGSDLAAQLLATGNAELIEGNWWGDTYWGVWKGLGENVLGKLLMAVRDSLIWEPNGN